MSTRSAKRIALLLAAATLAATGAAWVGGAFGTSGGVDPAAAAALEPFDSCEQILEYADEHRWAQWPYYPMSGGMVIEDGAVPAIAAAESATANRAAVEDVVGPSETGTNVQEVGIDEPDIAKLAGETLFVTTREGIEAYDVGGDDPVLLARLAIDGASQSYRYGGSPGELLLGADRALLITASSGDSPGTQIFEIDIADPSEMSLTRTMEIEGQEISSRLHDGTAHLVMSSAPDYPLPGAAPPPEPEPDPEAGATGETGPTEEEETDTPAWLPRTTLTDAATSESASEPLFDCEDVAYPREFSGLGMLSVLTIDLEQGLPAVDTDAVMTNGQTVYASAVSLYVATPEVAKPEGDVVSTITDAIAGTREIAPVPQPGDTTIHRFDVGDPAETRYSASAEVKGRLLSQFSMSEHDGHLRVAATEGSSWSEGPEESESAVTVFAISDDELSQVGKVSGLGRGEEIQAVRFIGELGYVVTFEQTDPLYTIDISDPAAPRTAGELKIPGFSAYLHPVAEGMLLGIGQDGTQDGLLTGSQASLFDVSEAANPARVDELALSTAAGSSAAEWDHHAFLYAPDERLAVVPVTDYSRRGGFEGAVAMRVDPAGELQELGRFEDGDGHRRQIQGMMVVGERLVTISAIGIAMRDLETFEQTGSAVLSD